MEIMEATRLLTTDTELNAASCDLFCDCGTITKILSVTLGFFTDIVCIWPFGGCLSIAAKAGYNFNLEPSKVKKGITPIILLHATGFNESEFVVGRYYLNKKEYGSVFSFNMEGILTIDGEKGVDDLAKGIVREKIKEITNLVECNRVILIGHSMGGLIAAFYFKNLAKEDGIEVKFVFPIGSPARGTPTAALFERYTCGLIASEKRFHQMGNEENFCTNLREQALCLAEQGKETYCSVYSEMDWAVPGESGKFTENPDNLAYKFAGHYALVILPCTWNRITSVLDRLYELESNKGSLFSEVQVI